MSFISGDTMQSGTVTGISPSFTTHSSNNLADVAARVVEEFRHQNGGEYDDIFNFNDDYGYDNGEFSVTADAIIEQMKDENDCERDRDDDFEFAVVSSDVNSSSISTGEIVSYPLFDQSLLLDVDPNQINVVNDTAETDRKPSSLAVRLPLRKLFSEERDFGSSSSSEADDLDGIASGTYCVWKPKTQSSPERCKKSNSTGNSSRRWKFRDILYRSNSDSNESPFLLFKPLISTNKVKKVKKIASVSDGATAVATEEKDPANKTEIKVHRRPQSYLPSGQVLTSAFTAVNRSNRNLHLF